MLVLTAVNILEKNYIISKSILIMETTQVKNGLEATVNMLLVELRALQSTVDTLIVNNNLLMQQMESASEDLDIVHADNTRRPVCSSVPQQDIIVNDKIFALYRNPQSGLFYMLYRDRNTIEMATNKCMKYGFTERFYYTDSPYVENLPSRLRANLSPNIAQIRGCTIRLCPDKNGRDLYKSVRETEYTHKNV
jgi:hypothetical protein